MRIVKGDQVQAEVGYLATKDIQPLRSMWRRSARPPALLIGPTAFPQRSMDGADDTGA